MSVADAVSRIEAATGARAARGAAPRRPSVCFVSPAGYSVLAADASVRFIGGAEVQQSLLAVELARRGYRVSMVSMDYGQREGEVVRGVRLLKAYRPHEGLPVVRFVHPRMTAMWAAMRRADADVYYQRCSGVLTGVVAAFARRHGKVSVFAAAHDHDLVPDLPLVPNARDRLIFRWAMRRVTHVVTQTSRQQQLCRETFGRDSVQIDSAYAPGGAPGRHDGPVLWAATVKAHKQPHLLLDVAQRLPDVRFRVVGGAIGGPQDHAYFAQLKARAAHLPNVEMIGYVPYSEVESHFDGASVFVNTSVGEGFPNTFLQAWSRGVPTVSFFDPGTQLDGRPVGVVVPDVDAMVEAVRRLKADAGGWAAAGDLCRRAFEERHSVARVVDAYERLLLTARAPQSA